MPRLIPPALGNGWRPSHPNFKAATPTPMGGNFGTAVPVLDISDDSHELVAAAHYAAVAPVNAGTGDGSGDPGPMFLTGAVVQFDHVEGPATVHIGGSTLFEAATEVVTCVGELGSQMPTWVASTDEDLAAIVAEHFSVKGYSTCKVLDMSEVTA